MASTGANHGRRIWRFGWAAESAEAEEEEGGRGAPGLAGGAARLRRRRGAPSAGGCGFHAAHEADPHVGADPGRREVAPGGGGHLRGRRVDPLRRADPGAAGGDLPRAGRQERALGADGDDPAAREAGPPVCAPHPVRRPLAGRGAERRDLGGAAGGEEAARDDVGGGSCRLTLPFSPTLTPVPPPPPPLTLSAARSDAVEASACRAPSVPHATAPTRPHPADVPR